MKLTALGREGVAACGPLRMFVNTRCMASPRRGEDCAPCTHAPAVCASRVAHNTIDY